jgi:hypothetical protein
MEQTLLTVRKVPTQAQAIESKAWLNSSCNTWNVIVNGKQFPVGYDDEIEDGQIALNFPNRQELNVSVGQMVEVVFPIETLHVSVAAIELPVDSIGVTVRRGRKWLDYVEEHTTINLCQCTTDADGNVEHTIIGKGRIENCDMCDFREIPARIVEQEHCVDARTYSGLLAAMKRAYPGFRGHEDVTWLQYRRIE